MAEPIVVVGIDNIANALNVGRKQILVWLSDPDIAFPAIKVGHTGRYMACSDNLKEWARDFLKPTKSSH